MKLLLLLMSLTLACYTAHSQQSDLEQHSTGQRYIKVVLESELTTQQAQEITLAFKQIPGIRTSRMDNNTGTYLGIYTPTDSLLDQTFLNWFENHGYTVKCYYDDNYFDGNMVELSKKTCH